MGVTETILQSATLALVIKSPLNHTANIQNSIDICKHFAKFFVSNLETSKNTI